MTGCTLIGLLKTYCTRKPRTWQRARHYNQVLSTCPVSNEGDQTCQMNDLTQSIGYRSKKTRFYQPDQFVHVNFRIRGETWPVVYIPPQHWFYLYSRKLEYRVPIYGVSVETGGGGGGGSCVALLGHCITIMSK